MLSVKSHEDPDLSVCLMRSNSGKEESGIVSCFIKWLEKIENLDNENNLRDLPKTGTAVF